MTDEQILGLMDALLAENMRNINGFEYRECRVALGHIPGISARRISEARIRCASIAASLAGARKDQQP